MSSPPVAAARSLPPRAIIYGRNGKTGCASFVVFDLKRLCKSSRSLRFSNQKRHLTNVRCRFVCRDSVGIRTQDPQLRRLLLYPAELPNRPALRDKSNGDAKVGKILDNTTKTAGNVLRFTWRSGCAAAYVVGMFPPGADCRVRKSGGNVIPTKMSLTCRAAVR